MAVGGLVGAAVIVGARLGVEQDGGDYRLHVAADAASVIGERRGHALDIGRAGITFHQVLNQDFADEWPDVGMIEYVVEGVAHVLLWAQTRRLGLSVEQLFRPPVMFRSESGFCRRMARRWDD